MFIIFVAGVIVVFVPIGSVLWFIAAKDKYKKAKENTCGDLGKRKRVMYAAATLMTVAVGGLLFLIASFTLSINNM